MLRTDSILVVHFKNDDVWVLQQNDGMLQEPIPKSVGGETFLKLNNKDSHLCSLQMMQCCQVKVRSNKKDL